MKGAVRPACAPTSVNRATNGMPDGLPRGVARAVREATPCAHRTEAPNSAPATNARQPMTLMYDARGFALRRFQNSCVHNLGEGGVVFMSCFDPKGVPPWILTGRLPLPETPWSSRLPWTCVACCKGCFVSRG